MAKLLTISPSPHVHGSFTSTRLMRDVLLGLIPAQLVAIYYFGIPALTLTLISVISCMATEFIISKFVLKKGNTLPDLSALVTGVLLAFNLPSNLSPLLVILGAIFAIGVGKMSFGGLGSNPFNPALVGRVFLLISFPAPMTTWPVPTGFTTSFADAITGATPLGLAKNTGYIDKAIEPVYNNIPYLLNLVTGHIGGSMGEISAAALLIGLIWLLLRKVITWHIPAAVIGSLAIITGTMWLIDPIQYMDPLFHILAGGALLGAVFMATDYVSSPMTIQGMVLYGIGIGSITAVIRLFGDYPEGMSFAILIMNGLVPLINNKIKPERFGREDKK